MSLLAHDLRNPLSALLTNINFVASSSKGRAIEVEEALSDSAISCAMLGQVIGNLDVLSRVLSGAPLAKRPIALRTAVDEVANRFAPQAVMTNVRIEVRLGADAPSLMVEPTFFGRALDNLLANSLQYSPANGEIEIECTVSGDRGCVVILDGGPPVPAELRALATSGEWQGQAKQRYEARYGRGLGLYCAAEAARVAGGELRLGDRDGRSSFELSALLAPS
jgi:signal transduction histidine kinase